MSEERLVDEVIARYVARCSGPCHHGQTWHRNRLLRVCGREVSFELCGVVRGGVGRAVWFE